MFSTLSDSALANFRSFVSWIAVAGSGIGVFCAVLTILTTRETSKRAALRTSQMESALQSTRTQLVRAESQARGAEELARMAHMATQHRSLTPEQTSRLISGISQVPRGKIIVGANVMDVEADAFANQINRALISAGADLGQSCPAGLIAIRKQGGALLVKDKLNPPIHALPLERLFASVGIELTIGQPESAEMPDDTVVIWISRK